MQSLPQQQQRPFRVAVTVSYTLEVEVSASHSRDAAHAAVDKLRSAEVQISGNPQEISATEIISTRIVNFDR